MSFIRQIDISSKKPTGPEAQEFQALVLDVSEPENLTLVEIGKLMMPLGKLVDAHFENSSPRVVRQAAEIGAAYPDVLPRIGWPKGDEAFNTFVLNYFEWNSFWRKYSPDSAKWYRACFDKIYLAFLKGVAQSRSTSKSGVAST